MNYEKGTIYLIQPAELVGTERYKIGCSKKMIWRDVKTVIKKGQDLLIYGNVMTHLRLSVKLKIVLILNLN